MKNFKNKVIVITGAASGMGAAYADEFAKLGSKLALCDINQEELDTVVNKVSAVIGKENIYSELIDVADRNAIFQFAENVKKNLGNAHVIINNAGVEGGVKPIYNLPIDTLERVMQINFFGVVYGTKAFLPQLVENKEGAVVNVSSVFGLIAPPSCGDYCAAKFAVRGFTETLMAEFSDSPISIHCVHPGGIKTNIVKNKSAGEFAEKLLTTPPHDIAKYVIQSIRNGRQKIVYGNQSKIAWFLSNFIPQKLVNKILWGQVKKTADISDYKSFL